MPKIVIDEIEYNTENLTENGKGQLASLQFLQTKMVDIQNTLAIYRTAQEVYLKVLEEELKNTGITPISEHVTDTDSIL
jgi:hypothetical protein